MIVPEFWAEARVQERVNGRQITVRRFGWSDVSQEEAQAKAEERTQEAFQRIASGEKLERREPKVAYNGADGVPIREEILDRYGDAVITRNLYGARCLNTPNVLFADVDLSHGVPFNLTCLVYLLLLGGAIAWGISKGSAGLAVIAIMIVLVLGYSVASRLFRLYEGIKGGAQKRTLQRIRRVAQSLPDWHLRVYETPAGFRVLVMHQTFDPADDAVQGFFKALDTDPVYARMCLNQRCFRARVSPKPWRIGIQEHIRPRPGYWPVKPEYLPLRQRWTAAYEEKSRAYASCRFLESLGHAEVHPEARSIQSVHDELSRAHSGLPIA